MARRRRRQAPSTESIALADYQFNTVIRGILRRGGDKAGSLAKSAENALARCGCKCDPAAAIKDVPETGSDQVAFGSVATWMGKVKADDAVALNQVKAIQATAAARM